MTRTHFGFRARTVSTYIQVARTSIRPAASLELHPDRTSCNRFLHFKPTLGLAWHQLDHSETNHVRFERTPGTPPQVGSFFRSESDPDRASCMLAKFRTPRAFAAKWGLLKFARARALCTLAPEALLLVTQGGDGCAFPSFRPMCETGARDSPV